MIARRKDAWDTADDGGFAQPKTLALFAFFDIALAVIACAADAFAPSGLAADAASVLVAVGFIAVALCGAPHIARIVEELVATKREIDLITGKIRTR